MSLSWKYLHIPPTPYLPPQVNANQLTIVFDLEETLVHIDPHKDIILKRPGMQKFLESFHSMFEIVLFTNTSKNFTDRIMDEVDPKQAYFKYRLYQ
jgi:TFIIF-interacting CTD phosphatase-like protein